MSNNTNNLLVDKIEIKKRSLLLNYLQKSKSFLATLFQVSPVSSQPENYQSEQYEPQTNTEQYFYLRFTDRVDPSLYYTIFFPHQRF